MVSPCLCASVAGSRWNVVAHPLAGMQPAYRAKMHPMRLRFTCLALWAALFGVSFLASSQEPPDHHKRAPGPSDVALVSPPSPFDESCNASQSGTNFHNSAVEPFVTVDPSNPNHLIGVWQQDRWADGGSSGLMNAVSMDRGRTWTAGYASFSNCSGLPAYNRASDPWVAISPGGVANQISLSLADGDTTSAVLVSRSTDGGYTWGNPVTLIADTTSTGFNDKEAITADPNSNYVYAAWDRSSGNIRPFYFASSSDGGVTWSPARSIYNPGVRNFVTYNQILVLPDGAIVNLIVAYISNASNIEVIRSVDHGVTWSAPVFVALGESIGTVDAKTQAPLRTGAGLPNGAVDPSTGALYVVWPDARFSGNQRDGIALSKSTDGGLTWSAPVQVNQAANVQAFTPAVAAAGGAVAVTYFDFREDTPDPNTLFANSWRIVSADGGDTWRESPVYGPFDLNSAVLTTEGRFLGDYEGLVAAGGDFLAFFTAANSANASNPSSVFATATERPADFRNNGRIEINRHPQPYKPESPPKPIRRK